MEKSIYKCFDGYIIEKNIISITYNHLKDYK